MTVNCEKHKQQRKTLKATCCDFNTHQLLTLHSLNGQVIQIKHDVQHTAYKDNQ